MSSITWTVQMSYCTAYRQDVDPYRISTPIGYFFANSKVSQSGFDSRNAFSRKLRLARAQNKELPKGVLYFVLSPGVEPGASVPQTDILSIKLREQARNETEMFTFTFRFRAQLPQEVLAERKRGQKLLTGAAFPVASQHPTVKPKNFQY